MRRNITLNARASGLLILFAFSSISVILFIRQTLQTKFSNLLMHEGRSMFASLTKGQNIKTSRGKRYYYSYTGNWGNQIFRKHEEVNPDLYFILSEGKNVQILAYRFVTGEIFSHIKSNKISFGKDLSMLMNFSVVIALLGFSIFLLSFLVPQK